MFELLIELLEDNTEEKSLTSQCFIYDHMTAKASKLENVLSVKRY